VSPNIAVQAEVLVCARGSGGLLQDRMRLVAELWTAGIRAETVHETTPSLTSQYEYANARSIPWMVILHGATLSAADMVKVRASLVSVLSC
jgi:eukaryotic translation initiation factor 2-alpha kinase 4